MLLRTGTTSDAEAIAALIAAFQPQLTDQPDGRGADLFLASVTREAEAGYLASDRFEYILACEGTAMLGFIAMRDRTHVFHLFVRPEHQNQGIARALWNEAQRRTEADQPGPAYTVNASLAAVPVYEAFSFRATGPVERVHGISFLPMRRPGGDPPSPRAPRLRAGGPTGSTPMSEPTRTLIESHWHLANAREWDKFAQLLHPALRYEVPQTREYIEGGPGYLEMFRTWPGHWSARIHHLVCEASKAVCVIDFAVDAEVMTGISIFEVSDGLITKVVDYWPEPYDPPARATPHLKRRPE